MNKNELKQLNQLAFASLSGSLIETIFGIADQAIIGRTNIEGYAAVGVASNIIYLLTGTMGMLSMAFTILFSKAVGANQKEKAQKIFNTVVTLSLLMAIVFEILVLLFGKKFFSTFYHLDGKTLEYAYDYIRIAGIGFGINLLLFIFSAYFKNLKQPIVYLYGIIISLSINFILDYTLVFGKFGMPKLGVKGAAIGTVIGLLSHLLIYIFYFLKSNYIHYKVFIDKEELKQLIKVYVPLLGQDFVESTAFIMILTSFVTSIGVYYVASYNLIEALIAFVTMPIYAYAGSALMLVSQSYAKKDYASMRRVATGAFFCTSCIFVIVWGIFSKFPTVLCSFITNDVNLIQFTKGFIPLAIGIQIFNSINQIYKYCLQGINQEKWVFVYSTCVSIFACFFIGFFVKFTEMKLYGVYMGLGISYFILGIGYYTKFRKSCV